LLRYAARELSRVGSRATPRALDLGCGAGRNAIPLVRLGWDVVGLDLSWPMLVAAARRAAEELVGARPMRRIRASADRSGLRAASFDLLIAHGIWNLARSDAELRGSIAEAARLAAPGAGLFVFTFSRSSLPESASPVEGERFVFEGPPGGRFTYLAPEELVAELAAAGFSPDPAVPMTEYNRPSPRAAGLGGSPAILEAAFRFG
jgi:SAM-dependent methyltransferase